MMKWMNAFIRKSFNGVKINSLRQIKSILMQEVSGKWETNECIKMIWNAQSATTKINWLMKNDSINWFEVGYSFRYVFHSSSMELNYEE